MESKINRVSIDFDRKKSGCRAFFGLQLEMDMRIFSVLTNIVTFDPIKI